MLVAKYDPLNEFRSFRNGFDIVNNIINSVEKRNEVSNLADFRPRVNTLEGKKDYRVEIDLPGVKKEDVSVRVEENILTISGERKVTKELKEEDYYKVESSYGAFSRSFTPPCVRIVVRNL